MTRTPGGIQIIGTVEMHRDVHRATDRPTLSTRFKFKGLMVLAALFGSLASGAIHELGHAAVVWASGATVHEVHLFWLFGPPHISYSGSLSPTQAAVMNASGMLTATFAGWLCLVAVPFGRLRPAWVTSLALMVGMLLSQSLAWVILPLLTMLGAKPKDDVVEFLSNSGCPPLLLALLSLMLVVSSGALFFWRTRIVARIREWRRLSQPQK